VASVTGEPSASDRAPNATAAGSVARASRFVASDDGRIRLLRRLLAGIAIVLPAAAVVVYLQKPGIQMADALTYLAAGERLNAGHALYALGPGDRTLVDWFGVPFASPPFIAVLWRPLAALGAWTMVPWSIACAAGVTVAVWLAWRDHPFLTSLLSIALVLPLMYALAVGNVNGLLMTGTVIAGLRPRWAGVLIGVMAAIKVWPILLALPIVRTRRAALELAATIAVCAAISLVGAGWDNHVAYLDVVRHLGVYDTAPGTLIGVWWLPFAIAAVGSVVALVARSYRAAIIASTMGNPAFHLGAWATVLPAIVDYRRSR
jgi:hypothetical protein